MDITVSFTPVQSLSAGAAKAWLSARRNNEYTLLDVRQPAEYQDGHIPGAVLVPLPELAGRMREVPAALPVLVYCRSGNRSRSAASLLAEAGRTVFNLEGGMLAWKGLLASGPADQGVELIRNRVTPAQLASLAWGLEQGAASFYRAVLKSVAGEQERQLFGTLVAEEESHTRKVFDAFRAAGGLNAGVQIEKSLEGLMEGGISIDGAIGHLRSKSFSAVETLELAMQIEANSLDLYLKIIRWSGTPEVKTIFSTLVEEEKLHLARLGDLLENAVRQLRDA